MAASVETDRRGGWHIPAPVAHGLVLLAASGMLGGMGTGIYSAMALSQGLDKLDGLPSAALIEERRERQRDLDSRQNERLRRIEGVLFPGRAARPSDTMACMPLPPVPHRRDGLHLAAFLNRDDADRASAASPSGVPVVPML